MINMKTRRLVKFWLELSWLGAILLFIRTVKIGILMLGKRRRGLRAFVLIGLTIRTDLVKVKVQVEEDLSTEIETAPATLAPETHLLPRPLEAPQFLSMMPSIQIILEIETTTLDLVTLLKITIGPKLKTMILKMK
jgi:hypothetical protein